jgi:hypothetical protein
VSSGQRNREFRAREEFDSSLSAVNNQFVVGRIAERYVFIEVYLSIYMPILKPVLRKDVVETEQEIASRLDEGLRDALAGKTARSR